MANPERKCFQCDRITRANSRGDCPWCGAYLPEVRATTPAGYEEPKDLSRRLQGREEREHYLIPEVGDPIVLLPGDLFVMGRDPLADLVISAPWVSRKHAEIDWERGEPFLCELRSTEGTFRNGERVETRVPLRDGDEIRLGARTMMLYLHLTARELESLFRTRGRETTRRIGRDVVARVTAEVEETAPEAPEPKAPKPQPAKPAEPLARAAEAEEPAEPEVPELVPPWAVLGEVAPRHLVAYLEREQVSAVVTFFDGQHTGELYFTRGKWSHAFLGVDQHDAAMQRFLTLERIAFRVAEGGASPPPTDSSPVPITGTLAGGVCGELLQMIREAKASGVLTVFTEANVGEAVFVQGDYQQVSFGDLLGKFALPLIVKLSYGTYRFRPVVPMRSAPPPRPTRPPTAVHGRAESPPRASSRSTRSRRAAPPPTQQRTRPPSATGQFRSPSMTGKHRVAQRTGQHRIADRGAQPPATSKHRMPGPRGTGRRRIPPPTGGPEPQDELPPPNPRGTGRRRLPPPPPSRP